jgi:hypothetical protein
MTLDSSLSYAIGTREDPNIVTSSFQRFNDLSATYLISTLMMGGIKVGYY